MVSMTFERFRTVGNRPQTALQGFTVLDDALWYVAGLVWSCHRRCVGHTLSLPRTPVLVGRIPFCYSKCSDRCYLQPGTRVYCTAAHLYWASAHIAHPNTENCSVFSRGTYQRKEPLSDTRGNSSTPRCGAESQHVVVVKTCAPIFSKCLQPTRAHSWWCQDMSCARELATTVRQPGHHHKGERNGV